jgi:hypothetical protein
MIPLDTKPEIAAMQARIQDAMSGEQRVLIAFEASHHVHELAKQRIRDEHPDWPGGSNHKAVFTFALPSRQSTARILMN